MIQIYFYTIRVHFIYLLEDTSRKFSWSRMISHRKRQRILLLVFTLFLYFLFCICHVNIEDFTCTLRLSTVVCYAHNRNFILCFVSNLKSKRTSNHCGKPGSFFFFFLISSFVPIIFHFFFFSVQLFLSLSLWQTCLEISQLFWISRKQVTEFWYNPAIIQRRFYCMDNALFCLVTFDWLDWLIFMA